MLTPLSYLCMFLTILHKCSFLLLFQSFTQPSLLLWHHKTDVNKVLLSCNSAKWQKSLSTFSFRFTSFPSIFTLLSPTFTLLCPSYNQLSNALFTKFKRNKRKKKLSKWPQELILGIVLSLMVQLLCVCVCVCWGGFHVRFCAGVCAQYHKLPFPTATYPVYTNNML